MRLIFALLFVLLAALVYARPLVEDRKMKIENFPQYYKAETHQRFFPSMGTNDDDDDEKDDDDDDKDDDDKVVAITTTISSNGRLGGLNDSY